MQNNSSIQNHKILKFSYKRLIILILVAIGIYFLIPRLIGFKQGLDLIHKVKPIYIIIGILGQVVSYSGATLLLKLILKKLKYKLKFLELFRISSIGAFAIHFFPLGGAGEAAFNYYIFTNKDVSAGDILFMFIIRSIITYLGFFVVFALGLIIAPTHTYLTFNQKIISIILFVIIVVMTLWVRYLFRHREKFWSVGRKILNFVNWIGRTFARKRWFTPEKIDIAIKDLHDGFNVFSKENRKDWYPATGFAAIYWIGDMFTLYFSLLAFGYLINPGVLIFAYCIATLAGLLSFIPGGLGVIEGVMSLTLISLGVKADIAVYSVLLYRLISFWLLMPVGFVSFLTLQKEISDDSKNGG
jgi:uncharacterized protein (TIRG00374 family)